MSSTASPLATLRHAARWYRETPAPYWEGTPAKKAGAAGWIAGNMAAWTAVGLVATIGFVELLRLVAGALG